ncbi:DUF4038 domain-containing protein [bacterium]|nr:DUF4038 domain-containing protein [bacterium]
MKHSIWILGLLTFLPALTICEETFHPWEVIEITLQAEKRLENPYVETLGEGDAPYVTAVFTHAKSGKKLSIPGFWDGGQKWKVRFAPPQAGTWKYQTQSRDPGLDGQTGEYICTPWPKKALNENPTRRGLIQVNQGKPRPGRYFEYQDGAPFLWIGDTWWNWCKRGIRFADFKKLADDRAAKGFTVGQLFFAGRGWGRSASLLDETYTQPDIEHIRHVENYIRYANQKGLTVWIHGWWGSNNILETIGGQAIRRWWRYAIHRLHAYNVIWVLAGEYNLHNYGGFTLKFWNDLGRMIKQEDPYNRIASTHPTPPGWGGGAEAPQWSTAEVMHKQDWMDYNQSQVGHGQWRNEMIPEIVREAYQMDPAKPIVVTEPWYEFVKGNPTAKDIRFGAWSAILSGAAGHSYAGGHVWKAHVPGAPAGRDSWPMEMDLSINTLDYPGAQSLAFMGKILTSTEWWKLEPHPEFVIDNPSRYCAADPGEEYLVFLRYGGTVKIDMRDANPDHVFHAQWIDLTEQKVKKERDLQGGHLVEFYPPESYPGINEVKDWVIHIKRREK